MSGNLKVVLMAAVAIVAACTSRSNPITPSEPAAMSSAAASHDHNSAADGEKGYVDGWFEGATVELYYTKSFFCAEPPASAAQTNCEIGADAEVAPRPGPIPTIYAIAAAGGIPVDQSTLACRAGLPCFNHPGMIDASRVLGPGASSIGPVPHSHIVTQKRGGWYHTVNIRVRDVAAWNEIAAAKTLDKVRELQADGTGRVSADTPTNIYFFIASFRH